MSLRGPLRVVVFEGVQNLPLFAAEAQGCFGARGLEVALEFTPNSWTLRDGLAQGRYDIAHTAVDNAIAMKEMAGHDIAVVLGGDSGFNALLVQPGIDGIPALRGRTVLVDAPDTAFALVLYRILERHGLGRKDYAAKSVGATPLRLAAMRDDRSACAAIMNLPFRILAERAGLKNLGEATDFVGPYLSTSGFVMRHWAAAHDDALVRYIQAYVTGLRWCLDPANRAAAIELLARRLRLATDVAAAAYAIAAAPGTGLARDGALDESGLRNVLEIRAQVQGQWSGAVPSLARYVEGSYHARALQGL
ncbi:MAG: ABC transporter substrate-binding protein [Betaproteobacteria bacterium]|nr:ABC transporter substrate-binding protein [Betaproteobacteria bacterium]